MLAPSSTTVPFHFSFSGCGGWTSFMNITPCPMKQSLPIVTMSQTKEWL